MIKNFDLTGWTCFSDRRNSKSYVNADKTKMVKFDTEVMNRDISLLEKEKEITIKAIDIGIKTPKVYDVVELSDGTIGLMYDYITGKKSIARTCGEDLDNYDKYMKIFAEAARDFHSCVCDPKEYNSFEDRIRRQLKKRGYLNDEQMKKALDLLDNTEKKCNCIHGDFHTGNWIIADDKVYVIDLGAIAYGNPIYDVANFYFFTNFMHEGIAEAVFHCKKKYTRSFWESFAKYYYGIKTEEEMKSLDKKMSKYALVSFHGMFEFVEPHGDEIKNIIAPIFDKVFSE